MIENSNNQKQEKQVFKAKLTKYPEIFIWKFPELFCETILEVQDLQGVESVLEDKEREKNQKKILRPIFKTRKVYKPKKQVILDMVISPEETGKELIYHYQGREILIIPTGLSDGEGNIYCYCQSDQFKE